MEADLFDRALDCIAGESDSALPLHAARRDELDAFLASLPPAQAAFLRQSGFAGAAQDIRLLPGGDGLGGAVLGLGEDRTLWAFGDLPSRLPEGTTWRLMPGDYDSHAATLGFCLGAYRYQRLKSDRRKPVRLAESGQERALQEARAAWLVRDLINTPPNLLGPVELAEATGEVGRRFGAETRIATGAQLESAYPAVAAVGAGSARAPCVAVLRWQGSAAAVDAPLVSLCGKGVCFDTGGYDLKPSAAMLRMKKDMGGAATLIGLAALIMARDLPVRLVLRVGCVENSVSGSAMRPSDVLRTRRGLTVEVGNTDAEGRLVLCDLLAEASDESPAVLVDCATLTGAARVAVGPDLPVLFCNDESWADSLVRHGAGTDDPLWRLPLWDGYDSWLASAIADVNNMSAKPHAGAVTAALFLRRFIAPKVSWAHFDLYAWNDNTRPGRPEGGEAQAMRALYAAFEEKWACFGSSANVR